MTKSKVLISEFVILTTLAVTVISSVFLANFSLYNSMNNVIKKSNLNGFTVENKPVDNFSTYNLLVQSQNINRSTAKEINKNLDTINNLKMTDLSTDYILSYNPLNISTQITYNNQNYEYYGLFEKYTNPNLANQPNSLNKTYHNLVLDNNGESISVVTQLMGQQYANTIANVFSFYNNIIPPEYEETINKKYSNLFDLGTYNTNPWSIQLNPNTNQLGISDFGLSRVDGFNDFKNEVLYNHGIANSELMYIPNYSKQFLPKQIMDNNAVQISDYDKGIIYRKNYLSFFSNGWKQISLLSGFKNDTEFRDFLVQMYGHPDILINIYSSDFYLFLNSLSKKIYAGADHNENIHNDLMQNTKYFSVNYKTNANSSNGLANFFTKIYNENKYNNQVFGNDPTLYKKYFEGTIKIPAIPFITVLPKDNNLTAEQTKLWASTSDNYTDPNQSVVNYDGINTALKQATDVLSKKSNDYFETLFRTNTDFFEQIRQSYYKTYNLNYYLKNIKDLEYSISSNFNLNTSINGSFIITYNKQNDKKVNDLIIYEGTNLFKPKINNDLFKNFSLVKLKQSIIDLLDAIANNNVVQIQNLKNQFINDNNFWFFINVLRQSDFSMDNIITSRLYRILDQLLDISLLKNNFNLWAKCLKYFYDEFEPLDIKWSGGGIIGNVGFHNDLGAYLIGSFQYIEQTSNFVVLSPNYTLIKNKTKQIVDEEFARKSLLLPYSDISLTYDDILNNPLKYKNNLFLNPYTNKVEPFIDFKDWISRLPDQFKLNINGDNKIILGTGLNAEFMYPISNKNELLINNNTPVVYCNEVAYDGLKIENNIQDKSHYFINYPSQYNIYKNQTVFNDVKNFCEKLYKNKQITYKLNDYNQPDKVLYLRYNFPNTILKAVFIITLIIGLLIALLAITFIYILIKSIVKQNLNTFAIALANGIKKRTLLFSFIPYVLIPGIIAGLVGYGLAFLIYPIISNAVQDYWILSYIHFQFSIVYLLITWAITLTIIFVSLTIAMFVVMNKSVTTLLASKLEFKHNKLIKKTSTWMKKSKSLTKFRFNYILGNASKVVLLIGMMTAFVTLTTVFASTTNLFNVALNKTKENKEYNIAVDLYSPTAQGGYYYNTPYSLVGTSYQGLAPLYDFTKNSGFYDRPEYGEALAFEANGQKEELTNLFLPSADLIGAVQGQIRFFLNKIFSYYTLNFSFDFGGNEINPWYWARDILPISVQNIFVNKAQNVMNYLFTYLLSIQNDPTNPDREILYLNKSPSNNLIKDLNNSDNPAKWNQSNWLINRQKNLKNKYEWVINRDNCSTGLPNFTMKPAFVNLIKILNTLDINPRFKKFISELENKLNKKVDYSQYMLALNVVPIDPNLDETYTYINGTELNKINKKDIKIIGIKPDSKQMVLKDDYNNNSDLKVLLQDFDKNYPNGQPNANGEYPLIINEVVQKKYKINKDDVIIINANNKLNRYIDKFNNIPNTKQYKFKVLGITTTKSEEQFYTSQAVANNILEFKKPTIATSMDLQSGNFDYKWPEKNAKQLQDYIPFNGVFSKQENPYFLNSFCSLYSFSGLSPISGAVPTGDGTDASEQIKNSMKIINQIMKIDIINGDKGGSTTQLSEFAQKYKDLFGTYNYYTSAIIGVDSATAPVIISSVIDQTIYNINSIVMTAILPSIIIVVTLMAFMLVIESRRLIALLKVLGFNNWQNTVTLATIQMVAVVLSVLLGYGFAALTLWILKTLTFSFLSIIIMPFIPWWTAFITIGSLLFIVFWVICFIYISLRKTNPAQEIAVRI